jgi:hypothetical protein
VLPPIASTKTPKKREKKKRKREGKMYLAFSLFFAAVVFFFYYWPFKCFLSFKEKRRAVQQQEKDFSKSLKKTLKFWQVDETNQIKILQ